ncbi:endonuclease [Sulfitobacter albidus]|uniref:Endonuclease n=1 Tax=Sulfitobacter albidus TaxID=2829501 RepID=A0A975PNK1_9RHOB|nr:endonuclease/exonuclease/phosphatase family protein [Sulfitobacter albidus]QUJ77942.1 endonuclease [Sulfitobacter albidus]
MRIATYNVEWFAALFDEDDRLFDDGAWSARWDVTRAQQTAALGRVFQALDADAVMVIEAPDAGKHHDGALALRRFAERFGLRAREAVIGFVNDTQQEIALMYDPDRLSVRHDPQEAPDAPRFDKTLHIDLDIDAERGAVIFSKPPLELAVETRGGFAFRMIGAHLKSKAPHGARDEAHAMQIAIANRRKQLAQAIWLRARVTQHLSDRTPLMVIGDLNDGPGLDAFEDLFGCSSVEIVLGQGGAPPLYDPHAAMALGHPLAAAPTTARFYLKHEERYLQALLDYIMVSADLRARGARWRILHPMDDPACWADAGLRDALIAASDHFPVLLTLDI